VQLRAFGRTGVVVPVLGFGAMPVGDPDFSEDEAARVLNGVVDAGLTLIDTARSYGVSEERIGRHLAHRRDEFVLSTKVGYGVAGVPDWSYDCVVLGVDAARARLRTDVIDIVHLHSCPRDVLRTGAVVAALQHCLAQGSIRVAAYSGDDDALAFAQQCGAFGSLQASLNLCDQQSLPVLDAARGSGAGTIVKRSLAGRPWSGGATAIEPAHVEYRRRFAILRREFGCEPADWDDLALRFAVYGGPVDCVIVGGRNIRHVQRNLAAVAAGPLPAELGAACREAFARVGQDWRGLI